MKIKRSAVPSKSRYSDYKEYIRKDFLYVCIYCGIHENAYSGYRRFQIDHVKPKSDSRFITLENDYSNLVYSCPDCNLMKKASWPSDDPIVDGRGWLDPEQYDYEDFYTIQVTDKNIKIIASKPLGKWLINELALDHPTRLQILFTWYGAIRKIETSIAKVNYILDSTPYPEEIEAELLDIKKLLEDNLKQKLEPQKFETMTKLNQIF